MDFAKKSFRELFEAWFVQFRIPEYQRAFEWDTNEKRKRNQVKEFWEDLQEFMDSTSAFPLGNIIVLKERGEGNYYIVDGQQRITTSLILIKSIADRIKELGYNEIANDQLKKVYIVFQEKDQRRIKFLPQEYDANFWENFIIRGENSVIPETPSQKRIKDAKEFFDKQLKDLSFDEINKIRDKIENSTVVVITLSDKKEASSIFELQNDRGKTLSNLDKIKAFFIHQISICNGNEEDISFIYREFRDIYKILNSENFLKEDDVLLYHIQAHTELAYDYRELSQLKDRIKNKEPRERIEYIKTFSSELSRSYKAIQTFLEDSQEIACYLKDLEKFKFAFAYPFIIKAYKFFAEDKTKLYKFLGYLEKVIFIHNLVSTRAEIDSRLNEFLKKFDKNIDIDSFFYGIFKKLADEGYWKDSVARNISSGYMYTDLAKYILKRYEIHLRENHKEGFAGNLRCINVFKKDKNNGTEWWIEHIAPETENIEENNGYEHYDEDFINNYLNSIGNLLLTTNKHNISLGNRAFAQKLDSYKQSPMYHHREIETFAENGRWTKNSIRKRTETLVEFILDTWGLERSIKRMESEGIKPRA